MSLLQPFQAYTVEKNSYEQVIAPPYDVLTREQATSIAYPKDKNILHVTRADIDCDESISFDDELCYTKASIALEKLLDEKIFKKTAEPCYCIYRISQGDNCQTGIAGMLKLDKTTLEYLKKHEHTKPKKVADRARLLEQLNHQISPVLLTIKSPNDLKPVLKQFCAAKPADYQATDAGNYRHQVWVLSEHESKQLEGILAKVKNYYIADGHHRCAAALHAQQAFSHQQILSVVFPREELKILGYHRLVKDSDIDCQQLFSKIKDLFTIDKCDNAFIPENKASFGLYCNRQWYQLTSKNPLTLDVDTLHQQIIEPIFAINNPREDERIDFIGGHNISHDIEQLVDTGTFQFAFTLFPTQIDEIIDVADKDKVMPPKSTWFEPKLLDGFFMA